MVFLGMALALIPNYYGLNISLAAWVERLESVAYLLQVPITQLTYLVIMSLKHVARRAVLSLLDAKQTTLIQIIVWLESMYVEVTP